MSMRDILLAKAMAGGGASSWNDLKDKPFGEEKAFEPIVWDGNTEGLESVELGAETQLYKVSDQIIADSKDIAYYRYHNTANGGVDIDTAGDQITVTSIADGVFLSTDKMFLCCSVPFSNKGIDITPGVYFGKSVLSDRTFTTTVMYPSNTIKTLDEKYMPDSVKGGGGGVLTVLVTTTNTSGTAWAIDVPFAEISAAVKAGQVVMLATDRSYPTIFHLDEMEKSGDEISFLAFSRVSVSSSKVTKETFWLGSDGSVSKNKDTLEV